MIADNAFRARAAEATELRMRDTCEVTIPGVSSGSVDPATGIETDGTPTFLWSGPCRLRMAGTISGSSNASVAGDRIATSSPTFSVPLSAPRVPIGAIVKITAVPADDPAGHLRLGLRLRTVSWVLGTDMSAQRMTVEAVTG